MSVDSTDNDRQGHDDEAEVELSITKLPPRRAILQSFRRDPRRALMVVDLAVAPTGAGPTEEHVWCRIQTGEYVAANVMDSPIARPGACFSTARRSRVRGAVRSGVVHAVEDALYIIVLLRASHDCSAMHTLGRASVAQG